MPPPPPHGGVCIGGHVPSAVLPSTWEKFRVSVPIGPGVSPNTPDAIPPPPWPDVFPVTSVRLRVTVPSEFAIPAPKDGTAPPVIVRPFNVRLPLGAATKKRRNCCVLLRWMVVFQPLIVIALVTTGRPFPPATALFGAVSV